MEQMEGQRVHVSVSVNTYPCMRVREREGRREGGERNKGGTEGRRREEGKEGRRIVEKSRTHSSPSLTGKT